ncbi:hypothetical protein [Natrinema altunense]|uniref:YokE-like PH domain-containing protein n=1 Tax=Natrinema altunense (strain JCM 12890 / CGMCC 1.3731 / AJ2) TaxID=1227494 RepID=L9ZL30_NATA2|nr:hypothetical protein [Natrinema altunense]ELY86756.1 hypothetical protein C485_07557 [Natrinema altunense JCM 12890]
MALSKAQQNRLASYVADDETAITACTRGSVTYLLTDRRFFKYYENEEATTVKSMFLDGLGGVNIRREEGEDYNTESLAVGLIALLTGLVSFAVQGQMPEAISAVFLLTGFLGLCGGIIGLIYAFDTEESKISVQLQSPEGQVVFAFHLRESSMDFAKSLSKAASNAHTPDEEHVRTVSA